MTEKIPVRALTVLAYSNGLTLWTVNLPRWTVADIEAPGAFRDVAEILSDGDVVYVKLAFGVAARGVHKLPDGTVLIQRML
jgi:hypothetical protein